MLNKKRDLSTERLGRTAPTDIVSAAARQLDTDRWYANRPKPVFVEDRIAPILRTWDLQDLWYLREAITSLLAPPTFD